MFVLITFYVALTISISELHGKMHIDATEPKERYLKNKG